MPSQGPGRAFCFTVCGKFRKVFFTILHEKQIFALYIDKYTKIWYNKNTTDKEVKYMAQAMSQIPVGTSVWVVYQDARGLPWKYDKFRVSEAHREDIAPSRAGHRRYKIRYKFHGLPNLIAPTRCFISDKR